MKNQQKAILLFVLFASLCSFVSSGKVVAQTDLSDELLRLVRIETSDPKTLARELEEAYYDVLGQMTSSTIDVVVSLKELKELQERGFKVKELRKGRPLKERYLNKSASSAIQTGYSSLGEIIDTMNAAAASYPEIAKVIDLTTLYGTPTTFEGRHMYIIKISDNVTEDEDEPDIMIVSNFHGREVVTPVIALNAIKQFLSKYGSDPRITAAVNNYEIWIAPTWNPDGYNHVHNVDDNWRKNRRVFSNGTGVDLNRNYPHNWYSIYSGSSDVNSNTYKGPTPSSEPETQTMIALALDQQFEKLIDYHSSGREVLWGYHLPNHPFDNWLGQEAIKLATNSGYSNTRRPSSDGGNYKWQLAMTGTFAFLIETHEQFGPSYQSAVTEANRVWPGILWDIERPIPLSGHVRDTDSGNPVVAKIELGGVNFQTGETLMSGGPHGRYHVFLPPGQYNIRFSADGYLPTEQSVMIVDDSAQVLDIRLSKGVAPTRFELKTNIIGIGAISLRPTPYNGLYDSSTVVNITAIPASGWVFDGLSGDATGSENPLTIIMNDNKNIIATFSAPGVIYYTGFESGVLDTIAWTTKTSAAEGRIQVTTDYGPHSGNYHLTMDTEVKTQSKVTNEAWLHLDLSGKSQVNLNFWWHDYNDGNDENVDGIFFSDDGGVTFEQVLSLINGTLDYQEINLDVDNLASATSLNLTNKFIIKFQQSEDNPIKADDGFGFDDITVIDETLVNNIAENKTGEKIRQFVLHQNYPNPFNPVTKIKFDLPENGMVKLNIYNILGQKVLELVNRELNSGKYNYSFDAGNLPSGVYVYKLETKNYNQTRKMILMK